MRFIAPRGATKEIIEMMTQFANLNGIIVPASEAVLGVGDLAIQRGYGIFDFFKIVDGKPFALEAHLNRFYASAAQLRLAPVMQVEELTEAIMTLIHKNALPEAGIRITLTGGYSGDSYTPATPNLIITQSPISLNRSLPQPIQLVTYPYQRQLPEVKSIDYLMAIWLQPKIKEAGADDVLYHRDGVLTECPRANFFIVTPGGELVTPANRILKGITRSHVLEFASEKYKVIERDITLQELSVAREAFITSTTKHVLPVTMIDGKLIGDGKTGAITSWLSKVYNDRIFAAKN